jgi:pyrroline-5-carboxylate reductase
MLDGLINNDFNDDSIIVSLDPDINFAKLALRLQNFHKIARIMPSPSIFLNDAYVPVTFSSGFNQTEKDDVLDLFGNFGKAVEVPEEKLQVYSTMSAVLHSYFWPQMDEMMRMGKELGLTPDETIDFINESFRSSLFMRYRSGLPEDQMTGLMGIDRDEDENETRELYRQRLVNLYRRHKSERTETIHSRRER